MTDIVALVEAWLAVLPGGDFDAFPGEISPDFVLRLPFVPPGVPSEFKGRETARAALQSSAKHRSPLVFTDKVIRRTEDAELVVTTAKAEATMASGKVYRNEYVMLTRIRGRTVIEHVEYLNPLAIMAAMAD
jgi:ketosteroid isomerase-like protein